MTPGYRALHDSAAVIDLSARGRIRVSGEDRARLLHAMTTNHVLQLQPGQGLYAFFLDAQGRILLDAYLLCFSEYFLVDVEPERREFLMAHLDKFIIADDVQLEDVTDATWCLSVEGPLAKARVELAPFAHAELDGITYAGISSTGTLGYRMFGSGERPALDFPLATAADAEVVRLEHYKPRYGVDITDKTLPQESQLMSAVHFQKGCYIGQEIVERVRSRGLVNRLLMGFKIGSALELTVGEKVFVDGKEVGKVTSSATNCLDKTYGLAVVRVPAATNGERVEILHRPATLHNPVF